MSGSHRATVRNPDAGVTSARRHTDLRGLAARAAPLHRRLHCGIEPDKDQAAASARLQAWQQALSTEGDHAVLARRLAFDRLEVERCLPLLGTVRLAAREALPAWVERFDAWFAHPPSDDDGWVEPIAGWAEGSLPFWEVWVPLVTCATRELENRAGTALSGLSEDALRSFQWQLLARLAYVSGPALTLEFRRFRARHDPLSVLSGARVQAQAASRELYGSFVRELQGGGLLSFFEQYAVLARLMSEAAGHWAEHVAELCLRLAADRAALAERFNQGADVGDVAAIRTGLSDPHHGGRDVVIVTFASGMKLVYKPKDLSADVAFWSFIDWINAQAPRGTLPLRTLTVLNRETHGWVECVEHRACGRRDEVRRYYERIGMLLCVAYVLGASDFHQENIIASGEQPVLLDLETLLQPLPRPWDGLYAGSADERAVEVMHRSVLRTGLLPFWIVGNAGKSYDVSGIGAEPSDTGYRDTHWEDINTDAMRLVYSSLRTEPQANRPLLGDEGISAEHYVAEMISGFTAIYRLLLARRDTLLAESGPLPRFAGLKLRCLLRMTKAYAQILNRRLHPEFLRDGADAGIELERLARDFVAVHPRAEYPPPWGVYRAEADALERLDIPVFSYQSDADALFADGRMIAPGFFAESGLERMRSLVRELSEDDLRAQTDAIRASLHGRYASREVEVARPRLPDEATAAISPPALTRGQFIAAATALAERIEASAIHGDDGSVTWLSLAFDPSVDRMNALPMTDNLYDGRLGTALFLAALEHVTGGIGFRDLALAAALQMRKALRHRIPPLTGRTTLGGAAGLGSQLYVLVRLAAWLRDDELLHLASRAAAWFIPERIARDDALDVFGGAAGGILGLLTLSAAGASGEALDRAVACGDHLLDRRVRAETGHWVWRPSWVSRALAGFGHGAAGIAYALLRLSRASGEPRFRQAAEEGIGYERAIYSQAARNWPDFRRPAGPQGEPFMVAWCSGAPGIGLARLGALPILDTPAMREDIANALDTTRTTALSDEDHVCCGNAGRLELLAEAGLRLGRPELLDEARALASVLVRRAADSGRYRLFAQVPGVTDSLSFFHGTAGIGYELLRMADPDRVPSVLLWA